MIQITNVAATHYSHLGWCVEKFRGVNRGCGIILKNLDKATARRMAAVGNKAIKNGQPVGIAVRRAFYQPRRG